MQTQIPIESLSSASSDLGSRFQKSPNSAFQFVGFPTFQKEFQDPRVRRAISMAINRQEMTDQIFLGSQTPATSFVSPVVAGYRAGHVRGELRVQPDQGQAAVHRGATGPKSITLAYNVDGGHKAWIDAMCNQIKASLGINCVGDGEPKLSDLLDQGGEEAGRRPHPARLGAWTTR